jgi:hypothetical protein
MDDKEIDKLMKKHVKASNSLDLDLMMETWTDDTEFVFLISNTSVKGKENLRSFLQKNMFDPVTKLETEIAQEIQFGNFRTYVERVTECSNPDFVGREFHWTLEFADGKIKRVWTLQ